MRPMAPPVPRCRSLRVPAARVPVTTQGARRTEDVIALALTTRDPAIGATAGCAWIGAVTGRRSPSDPPEQPALCGQARDSDAAHQHRAALRSTDSTQYRRHWSTEPWDTGKRGPLEPRSSQSSSSPSSATIRRDTAPTSCMRFSSQMPSSLSSPSLPDQRTSTWRSVSCQTSRHGPMP